ncbi:HNH endonuclease [Deinococcus apachensis]|uniref:HNH endonuclease n=1 Tax=Deinococcus apachensis TaxID=309886 RepID=UPI000379D4BB|nr:HNH endonuclease [Deinococcus apachensis]
MPRVIIQPAAGADARAHYEDTIRQPVPIPRIRTQLAAVGLPLPDVLASLTAVPVWGVTPGSRGQNARCWEQVQPGDVALFYGQKRFFASSVVIGKIHAATLARDLWGNDPNGQTWEYVYFLDEITDRSISVDAFNQIMRYSANNIPQGFQVVADGRAEDLLALFSLESSTSIPAVSPSEYNTLVELPAGELDRQTLVNQRLEQRFLRRHLFQGHSSRTCCICGRNLPVELLVAAHIKRRADCTAEEKRDYQNLVAPMCQLGCDDLYERQYITVDHTGTIRRNPNLPLTSDLQDVVAPLEGRACPAWTPGTQQYFEWHARNQRRRAS